MSTAQAATNTGNNQRNNNNNNNGRGRGGGGRGGNNKGRGGNNRRGNQNRQNQANGQQGQNVPKTLSKAAEAYTMMFSVAPAQPNGPVVLRSINDRIEAAKQPFPTSPSFTKIAVAAALNILGYRANQVYPRLSFHLRPVNRANNSVTIINNGGNTGVSFTCAEEPAEGTSAVIERNGVWFWVVVTQSVDLSVANKTVGFSWNDVGTAEAVSVMELLAPSTINWDTSIICRTVVDGKEKLTMKKAGPDIVKMLKRATINIDPNGIIAVAASIYNGEALSTPSPAGLVASGGTYGLTVPGVLCLCAWLSCALKDGSFAAATRGSIHDPVFA